jgi:hypothetical protein
MGRVGVFVSLDELVPLNGIYPPDVIKPIAERYSFLYPPDLSLPLEVIREKGMQFREGKFPLQNTEHVIQTLHVFGSGIAVTAYDTHVAEAMLQDLFQWSDNSLGFRSTSHAIDLFFLSQMTIRLDQPIDAAVGDYEDLSNRVKETLKATYSIRETAHVSELTFNFDRTSLPEQFKQLSAFTIQRRVGEPYSSLKFFSSAPFRTRDHLALLEHFEERLRAK